MIDDRKKIGTRLEQFRKAQGWSKSKLSDVLGIYSQNVNRYLEGESDQSKIIIKLIDYGLNPEWVRTGKGDMYVEEKPSEQVQQPVQDPLNEVLKRIERLEKAQKTPPELTEEVKIPLYQHAVSAGPACTVSAEIEEYLTVPKKIARHPRETFAVRASGDSMTGEDIREGDIVICDSRTPVKTGCVVIASVDGAQTLKKIVLDKGSVTLVPANHHHDPIAITDNSNLVILGVVIALFRTLY